MDKLRSGDETGSVAINTAPKAKDPINRCQMGVTSKKGIVDSVATKLNKPAIKTAPKTQDNMVRQLPTPVPIRIAAPTKQNNTEVSPILPGINPMKQSTKKIQRTESHPLHSSVVRYLRQFQEALHLSKMQQHCHS